MCVKSLSHGQLFATPWTVACQAPHSMGFSKQEYWSGLPFPLPGESSWPRDQTQVSCVGRRILHCWVTRKAYNDFFSSVQSFGRVWLFATPWTTACQASLSITNTWSLPKLMSVESVTPSNHLILCRPLLLLPSIFPIIRVFSNELALRNRWPKYWSFSFNISPSNEHPGLISFRMTGWISFQSKGLSRVFSNTTVQKHHFFCTQLSL